MQDVKVQYENGIPPGTFEEVADKGFSSLFVRAIENADGIPFQLIFGRQIGQGYYLNIGTGIEELLGVAPEDFTEKLYQSMIEEIVPLSEDIPADPAESRRKFLNREINHYKAETLIRRAGGDKKWICDTSLPLINPETGKVTGAFGILYDITSRKLKIDEFNRTKEKPDDCYGLEATFLHNISHEIRTPLNAIVGFSTFLSEQPVISKRYKEYLDIILRSSDHLLEVIDDIVEISKIESKTVTVAKKKVNLNSIIRKVNDRFSLEAAQKGLLFSYNITPDNNGSEILTDEFKVTQVLMNLLSNALKFTRAGKVEFGYSLKEGKVEFYVSDTGTGIVEEDEKYVFNRFYQCDSTLTRTFGGLGLGLPISKAYVELLGGKIWFTSRFNEGSVFRFTIPAERESDNVFPAADGIKPVIRRIKI